MSAGHTGRRGAPGLLVFTGMAHRILKPAARLVGAWLVLLLAGWGLGAVVTSGHWRWDQDVVNALRLAPGGSAAGVTRAITFLGSGWLLIPLALLAIAGLAGGHRPRSAAFLFVAVGGAIALSNAVKALVARPRPAGAHLVHVASSSWPSGHATTACATWGALALVGASILRPGVRRRLVAGAATLVAAVACSRVLLGVHFPTDVIAGVVLAGLWVLVAYEEIGLTV